jgi:uncharacterized protein with HEPN domain
MRHESLYLTDIIEAADHITEFTVLVGQAILPAAAFQAALSGD